MSRYLVFWRPVTTPNGSAMLCISLDLLGSIEAIEVTAPGNPMAEAMKDMLLDSGVQLLAAIRRAARQEMTVRDIANLFDRGTPQHEVMATIAEVQEAVMAERLSVFGKRVS